jgi:oxygen-dependent protoporphyrinogen oxidase
MRLVTRYALPKLYNLEQTYGSFTGGAFFKALERRTERDRMATKKVFSVHGGLNRLTDALADAIGRDRIIVSVGSIKIEPCEGLWEVEFVTPEGRQILNVERVITTVGAYALRDLLPFVEKREMDKIACLRYAPVVQVSIGVRDVGKLDFRAFGGLVPSCEGRDVLGILFSGACFEGRAPKGGMLFSFFMGGVKKSYLTELSDCEIENIVVREFHEMLGFPLNKEPDLLHISRHVNAIPQYEKDTGERIAAVERLQKRFGNLIVAGNLRDGVSMADRIRQGVSI